MDANSVAESAEKPRFRVNEGYGADTRAAVAHPDTRLITALFKPRRDVCLEFASIPTADEFYRFSFT